MHFRKYCSENTQSLVDKTCLIVLFPGFSSYASIKLVL